MSEKTIIYIVRHGESVGNLLKICLGHTDLGLTDRGREQAVATAKALLDVDFDAFYSSDLIRAVETAAPHLELRCLDANSVRKMSDLRELYFGDWENGAVEDLKRDYGDMFTVGWRQNFGTFTAPKGESVVDCATRMENTLKSITKNHPGKNILVVTHAASIRALWGKISGLEPQFWCDAIQFPSNASYSTVSYDKTADALKPLEYSCDEHLDGLKTALPG